MNNQLRYRKNYYCPNCGSNVEGSHVGDDGTQEQCDECGDVHAVKDVIEFWVDASWHRPDPLLCCRCNHRGDSPLPWVEGRCKDLPFWLMTNDEPDSVQFNADNEYLNEIECTLYE